MWDAWHALPDGLFPGTLAPAVKHVIVEIGTNVNPETFREVKKRKDVFAVWVEPITTAPVVAKCASLRRCAVIAGVVFPPTHPQVRAPNLTTMPPTLRMAIAKSPTCSTVLSGGHGCAELARHIDVPVFSLDDILDRIPIAPLQSVASSGSSPPTQPASMVSTEMVKSQSHRSGAVTRRLAVERIIFDCQGADLLALSTLRRHRDSVGNLIVECQDLPLGHQALISGGASGNCGQILACVVGSGNKTLTALPPVQHLALQAAAKSPALSDKVTSPEAFWPPLPFDSATREEVDRAKVLGWPGWEVGHCTGNLGPREFNCPLVNTKHPLGTHRTRAKFNPEAPKTTMERKVTLRWQGLVGPAACPDQFFRH